MASRSALRQRAGAILAALYTGELTRRIDGNTLDLSYVQEADLDGRWLWEPENNRQHRVIDSDLLAPSIIVTPGGLDPGSDFELWSETWPPVQINNLINVVIAELHGRVYQDRPPFDFNLSERNRRFDLDDDVTAVKAVERRSDINYMPLFTYGVFENTDQVGMASKSDAQDSQWGTSQRIDLVALTADATFESTSVNYLGLQGMTHLELWTKHRWDGTGDQPEVDIVLLDADDVAQATLRIELEKDTWEYKQIDLPSDLIGSIASVQLRFGSPAVAQSFHLNGVWAVDLGSVQWVPLRWTANWHIVGSHTKKMLEFRRGGVIEPPLSVMRVETAGDLEQLDSDTDTVPNRLSGYIVEKVLALAYDGVSGGPQVDAQRFRQQADRHRVAAAMMEAGAMPMLADLVVVSRP